MLCEKCRTIIPDDSIFCENCGAPTGLIPEEMTADIRVGETLYSTDDGIGQSSDEILSEVQPDDLAEILTDDLKEDLAEFLTEEPAEFEEPVRTGPEEELLRVDSVPVDPVWWEPPEGLYNEAEDAGDRSYEADDSITYDTDDGIVNDTRSDGSMIGEPPVYSEEEEPPAEPEIPFAAEEIPAEEGEGAEKSIPHIDFDVLKAAAADAVQQTKPYADKARVMLKDLGKHVRTGTGWAAEAAKEQAQKVKEDLEEKKDQIVQQREQEKEEKERKRAEQARLDEERRQWEASFKVEENVVQQEGFWYGDEMPERPAFDPEAEAAAAAAAAAAGIINTEDLAEGAPVIDQAAFEATAIPINEAEEIPVNVPVEVPTSAPDEIPAGAPDEIPAYEPAEELLWDLGESQENAAAENQVYINDEILGQEIPVQEVPGQDPDEYYDDKLDVTGRFLWSDLDLDNIPEGADIDELAAAALAAAKAAAEGTAGEGPAAEAGTAEADAAEDAPASGLPQKDIPEDDPAIYRIENFEKNRDRQWFRKIRKPGSGIKFKWERKHWLILAIVLAVLVGAGVLIGVQVHNLHVQKLEDEAFAAHLNQAHELAKAKKYDEAEALYLQLMDQRPEDTAPCLGLGEMYVEQERYRDAKALIKRSIKATGDKEAFKPLKKRIKLLTSDKWKEAYIKVLEEYEDEIRRYEDDVVASVAVCDVNKDLSPELFFFTKEYYGYGKLHIFTMVNGQAKKVSYDCKNRGTQYQDAFYDISSDDTSYAVLNSEKDGQFTIYANIVRGGDSWDTINEFTLNLQGGCRQVQVMESSIDTTYRESEDDDSEYLIDDEDVSYEKYLSEFQRVMGEAREVILYNGSGGDQSVWTKVTEDNVMCMTYDSMLVDLGADD